jgi:hypothetical protein
MPGSVERVGFSVRISEATVGSGRASSSLEATLASHPAIHATEGEFFREIVLRAGESCGLRVRRIKEKELFNLAERQFEMTSKNLMRSLEDLGKMVRPPWQQDQKFAALAACLARGAH